MKRLLALFLAALSVWTLASCSKQEDETPETPQSVAVQVKTIERQDVATESKVSGTVTSENETSIFVAVTAKCTAVYVEAGDAVEKGDKICTLDLGSTLANYSAARINYDSAVTSYEQQKSIFEQQLAMTEHQISLREQTLELTQRQIAMQETTLANTKALYAIGAAAKIEVEQAELALDQAKSGLDGAQAELDSLRLQLLSTEAQRDSTLSQLRAGMESSRANLEQLGLIIDDVDAYGNVIAPASGLVSSISAKEGSYISASAPVAVISGAEQMKITVYVSEALVPKLTIGDAAHVSIAAANVDFTGTIRSIEQSANAQTKLYGVSVSVPSGVDGLLSGMFADVVFYTQTASNTLAVPSESLLTAGDEQYVYVVENNAAKRLNVTTGLTGDGITEVLSGLSEGDQLVIVGQQYLSDGDAVRVVGGA